MMFRISSGVAAVVIFIADGTQTLSSSRIEPGSTRSIET